MKQQAWVGALVVRLRLSWNTLVSVFHRRVDINCIAEIFRVKNDEGIALSSCVVILHVVPFRHTHSNV